MSFCSPEGWSASRQGAYSCTYDGLTNCPAGSGEIDDAEGCYPCGEGFYQSGDSLTCAECSDGSFPTANAEACANACPAGQGVYFSDSKSCAPCFAGYYNDGASVDCQSCLGTNKPNEDKSACNQQCEYPYVSVYNNFDYNMVFVPGAFVQERRTIYKEVSVCGAINYGFTSLMATLIAVFSFTYVGGLLLVLLTDRSNWSWKMIVGFMVYTVTPVVDCFTDIAYLLTNDFFVIAGGDPITANIIPILCAFAIGASLLVFPVHLLKIDARCAFPILPLPSSLSGKEDYADLSNFMTILPWVIINAPFWLPWLVFGSFLYVSKIFAVSKVANLWYRV